MPHLHKTIMDKDLRDLFANELCEARVFLRGKDPYLFVFGMESAYWSIQKKRLQGEQQHANEHQDTK